MEASGHQLFDLFVVKKVMFKDEIDLVDVTPLYPGFELLKGRWDVEVLRVQQTCVH
jgi:hypothetical protein